MAPPRPLLAFALLAVLLPLAGAMPAPVAAPPAPGGCLDATADCRAAEPSSLPPPLVTPMAGTGTVLDLLGPFLSPELRRLLENLVGGTPFPELPPRPQGPDIEAQVKEHLKIKVAGEKVHVKLKAHVHVNASEDGPYGEDQVPCSDPRGCPDLVVDPTMLAVGVTGTQTFAASDCAVQEGSTKEGARRLLRFTFASPNLGNGDLVVGDPTAHLSWFEWGACHGHWHFRDYADYRLWTAEGYARWLLARSEDPDATPAQVLQENPGLLDGFVSGHKQGFCVIDVLPYFSDRAPKYLNCDSNQGISRGWADVYGFNLDGQWVDITDLAPGAYVLEAEVNPERLYQEMDYGNNSGALLVRV